MESYQQEISQIKKVLEENPKGMTVTDISRKIKVNRNSVAKYLDIMRISGHVEMLTFGPAKVFFPSRRVPIKSILDYISDFILIVDSDLKITMINKTFLDFIKEKRERITGQSISDLNFELVNDNDDLNSAIEAALEGKDIEKIIETDLNKAHYFKIKIIPTTFEDGKHGVGLIIKNVTNYKVAEKALEDSEQSFRSLLEKMKKK